MSSRCWHACTCHITSQTLQPICANLTQKATLHDHGLMRITSLIGCLRLKGRVKSLPTLADRALLRLRLAQPLPRLSLRSKQRPSRAETMLLWSVDSRGPAAFRATLASILDSLGGCCPWRREAQRRQMSATGRRRRGGLCIQGTSSLHIYTEYAFGHRAAYSGFIPTPAPILICRIASLARLLSVWTCRRAPASC